jgi:hypothetical protein
MSRDQVFISYIHNDEKWLRRLQTALKPLVRKNAIDVWSDERIRAGQEWKAEIIAALARAKAAVLLVSQPFLASDFIADEEMPAILDAAQAEGLTIIWIPVTASLYEETEIRRYQAAHDPKRPLDSLSDAQVNRAFVSIAKQIRDAMPSVTEKQPQRSHKVSLGNLPEAGEFLIGREGELARLDEAWRSDGQHIITVVARGGEGKTSLVRHWLNRMAADNWRGAEHVFAWSFYSQGTNDKAASADQFVERALRFFGGPAAESIKSPHERGERLAQAVAARRNLLVLDGLEPLQYPHAPMQGRLKDPSLQTLLSSLSAQNRGLCVITTRESLPELAAGKETISPEIELSPLTPEMGAMLLDKLGVRGSPEERGAVTTGLGGHALSVQLLGTYLAEVHDGDVHRAGEVALLDQDQERGHHAQHILESYERWLSGETLVAAERESAKRLGARMIAVLRLLGLFDRPASNELLEVLRRKSAIEGLTEAIADLSPADWNRTLARLRKLKLIQEETKSSVDAHPLIREHFAQQLRTRFPEALREAHRRLYEHLKRTTVEFPETLEEMAPLYEAVAHGCKAGLMRDALETVVGPRIHRAGKFFSINQIGAYGAELAAFANMFEHPWDTLSPQLDQNENVAILNWSAFCLRAIGQLRDARVTMQRTLSITVSREQWEAAVQEATNLSETYVTIGDIASAIRSAEIATECGDCSRKPFSAILGRATLGYALHSAARRSAANDAFLDAEQRQIANSRRESLYSVNGFRFCVLLLDTTPAESHVLAIRERASTTMTWCDQAHAPILTRAVDRVTVGRTWLIEAQLLIAKSNPPVDGPLENAQKFLNEAVSLLRNAGQTNLPIGLLHRAALWRTCGAVRGWDAEESGITYLALAERDLDEVQQIAERGEMLQWRIEAGVERARLCHAVGNVERARELIKETKRLIKQTERRYEPHVPTWGEWQPPPYVGTIAPGEIVGYYRCNDELAALEVALAGL